MTKKRRRYLILDILFIPLTYFALQQIRLLNNYNNNPSLPNSNDNHPNLGIAVRIPTPKQRRDIYDGMAMNRLSVMPPNPTIIPATTSTTTTTTTTTTNPSKSNGFDVYVCPQTKHYFKQRSLGHAIRQSEDYYVRGGSILALNKYLNSRIQPTLDNFNITFLTQDSNETLHNRTVEYLTKQWELNSSPRGGYSQPLPGKFQGDHVNAVFHSEKERRFLEVQEGWKYREKWDVAMGPQVLKCEDLVESRTRTSPRRQDPKRFCNFTRPVVQQRRTRKTRRQSSDESSSSNSVVVVDEECHILSIGSNDQWAFEQYMLTMFPQCRIHTFDCTLDGYPKRKPKDVNFYPYCLSTQTETIDGRDYLSYPDLLSKANITSRPTLLKIDVEGFEYEIIGVHLMNASIAHIQPYQITMEAHWTTRMVGLSWVLRTKQAGELVQFFTTLFIAGGYLPVASTRFAGCYSCLEITLAKVKC